MQSANFHKVRDHWESVSKMQTNVIIAPGFKSSTKRSVVYDRIHRGACDVTQNSRYIQHSGTLSQNHVHEENTDEIILPTSNETVQSPNQLDDNAFDEISTQEIVKGEFTGETYIDEYGDSSSACEHKDENKNTVSMHANGNEDENQIGNLKILIPGEKLQYIYFSDDENSISISTVGTTASVSADDQSIQTEILSVDDENSISISTVGTTASVSTDGQSIQTEILSVDEQDIEDSCKSKIPTSKDTNNLNHINERTPSVMNPHPKIKFPHGSPHMLNISSVVSHETASPLPDRSCIKKTGFILSRLSVRSMLMKKWHQTFWVQYGVANFLIFRKKEDFEQWLSNPHYTKKKRKKLVKFRLKFCDRIGKKESNSKDSRISPMKLKYFGASNTPLYYFKLERVTDLSVNKTIAFSSDTLHSALALRRCLMSSFGKSIVPKARSVDDILIRPTKNHSTDHSTDDI